MKLMNKVILTTSVTLIALTLLSQDVLAAGRARGASIMTGSSSLGLGLAYVGASQSDLNGAIDDANSTVSGGISTKNMTSAYELFANWIYRYDRTDYALVIRPSYFWQGSTGSNTSGSSYDYKLTGYTLFPMFRIYPLENAFIHFYMQAGLGYGSLSGDVTAGTASLEFKGSAFGAIGGIGVDFCFTETHCLTVEGNMRYLPIERNVSSGGSCTDTGGSNPIPGMTQCGGSREVERNYKDLQTTMSGIQGILAYTMNF